MKTKQWMLGAALFFFGAAVQDALAADLPAEQTPAVQEQKPAEPPPAEAPPAEKPAAATAPAETPPVEKPAAPPETPALPAGAWSALAKQNNVNVRGQAAINSEIVTRLRQGDRVIVLEEVVLKKPKPDEPARWAKIALPTNAHAWIHADFIDPNTKAVRPNRLNLRSGPGENYSILGRIAKGTVITELEIKGNWIKIEAPAGAYAFVAAHLLAPEAEPPAATIAATTPATPPPTETTVAVEPPPAVATEPTATPPTEVTPPTAEVPAPTPTEAAPKEPPIPKRIVTREGFVRNTGSIQAPTHFRLLGMDTLKTINYLHSTNIVLRDYNLQRIIVTGEELLDERWPNTPVIEVETIRTVP
jgi:hypothetical protein